MSQKRAYNNANLSGHKTIHWCFKVDNPMQKTSTLILLPIITIALLWALVYFSILDSFAFAWTLNFLLMACVSMFVAALKSPFSSTYFDRKSWEKGGKVYEATGINVFRKLLVLIGWEKLSKKSKPVEKDTESLIRLYNHTQKDELGHLIIFIIVLGFNVFVAWKFGFSRSLWLLGTNIFFNLYPILLQRYNRPRIERAINVSKRRVSVH